MKKLVIFVSEQTVMGHSNLMPMFVIMHGSEKAFAAIAYFVPAFVIMIGVCSQETLTAVSDLMAVLVVMIHPIRQQALAAEIFFHGFLQFMNES